MDELRALPEFLFGYVAPGVKPKVIVFLDAEGYGTKSPKGMVPILIPAGPLRSKEDLTRATGVSSASWIGKGRAGEDLSILVDGLDPRRHRP
ncbi:MAG: hypothetical protein ACREA0_30530 [bacterium]